MALTNSQTMFLSPNSLLYVGGKDKDKWCKKAFLLLQ